MLTKLLTSDEVVSSTRQKMILVNYYYTAYY